MERNDLLTWGQAPLDLRLRRPADGTVVIAAAVAGALFDLAVRSDVDGLGGALLVVAVAALVAVAGQPASWEARLAAGGAAVFGVFLAARTSPWLLPLDVLAAGGLLVVAASLSAGGSALDVPLLGWVVRAGHALLHGLAAPAFAWRGLRTMRNGPAPGTAPGGRPWAAVLRGLALALPLLVALGALLASADVLFARAVDFVPDLDDLALHAVLIGFGAWGMAGLLRVAAATPPPDVPRRLPLVGAVEATVVLGSLVVLFAAFAVTQLVALGGGGRHVVETAGLTYAEYARSGFFQLVAVAAITLAVLLAVDVFTDPGDIRTRRRFVVLSELCVGLTLVVVLSALRRLDLYENAYGLTMLRLYVAVLVAWVGVSLVLLGAWVAADRGRSWFAAATAGAGLAALLVLNVVNPEAVVVRRNVALAEQTGRFDSYYLTQLSDDAVPELVRSLPRLDEAVRQAMLSDICGRPRTAEGGWAAWNGGRDAAIEARNEVCPR